MVNHIFKKTFKGIINRICTGYQDYKRWLDSMEFIIHVLIHKYFSTYQLPHIKLIKRNKKMK